MNEARRNDPEWILMRPSVKEPVREKMQTIVNSWQKALVWLSCVWLFAGCASSERRGSLPELTTPPLDVLMGSASSFQATGQSERAAAILRDAGKSYPAEKAPWLKLAQLHFDAGNYVSAITFSMEVLQRDSQDKTALSLVAVSALRLSTKSLSELRSQSELSGTVRSEAQDLVKVLRESVGETVLVPTPKSIQGARSQQRINTRPSRTEPVPSTVIPASGEARGSANPFSALR